MKLGEIAAKLGCAVEGDANLEITGVAPIEEAKPGELTFLADKKYRPALATTHAAAVIVGKEAVSERLAALRSSNPRFDFARAIEIFHPALRFPAGVHPSAAVAKSAKIGPGSHIGPH